MSLTKEKLFIGVKKALLNAESLMEDAKLLQENKRFARSYTLFQLAEEEIGKAFMVYQFVESGKYQDPKTQKPFLADFRSHDKKSDLSARVEYLISLRFEDDPNIQKLFTTRAIHYMENTSILNDLKNHSLYTSYVNNAFCNPDERISEEMVQQMAIASDLRLREAKQHLLSAMECFNELQALKGTIDFDTMFYEEVERIRKILYA